LRCGQRKFIFPYRPANRLDDAHERKVALPNEIGIEQPRIIVGVEKVLRADRLGGDGAVGRLVARVDRRPDPGEQPFVIVVLRYDALRLRGLQL
jgi:hypothetical protein